jgi:LacI family transcriptional regulator
VLLLGPSFPREAVTRLIDLSRPLVAIDARHDGVDAVLADNREPMRQLTRHLVHDHGYRRLACLAGPRSWPSTAERVAGVRAAVRGSGATLRVLHASETTIRDGAELATPLADDPPDAIVAVNDAMAIGAMHRLRSLDPMRRPAITGFDDIAWAQLTDPPLTTVAVAAEVVGSTAADLLLGRIAAPDPTAQPAREVRVPATVRLRRSCGCGEPSRPLPDHDLAGAAFPSVHPERTATRGGVPQR